MEEKKKRKKRKEEREKEKGEERKKFFLLSPRFFPISDLNGSMSLLYREGESTYREVITARKWNPVTVARKIIKDHVINGGEL